MPSRKHSSDEDDSTSSTDSKSSSSSSSSTVKVAFYDTTSYFREVPLTTHTPLPSPFSPPS